MSEKKLRETPEEKGKLLLMMGDIKQETGVLPAHLHDGQERGYLSIPHG